MDLKGYKGTKNIEPIQEPVPRRRHAQPAEPVPVKVEAQLTEREAMPATV